MQTPAYRNRVTVSIVDWEATSARVQADLLMAALHWGNFSELTIWSATLPDETKALLRNTGFKDWAQTPTIGRYTPTVLVRPVRDEMLHADWILADRRLLDLTNWDLRMVYSDTY